ncbi:MAG: hypothetical protein C3F11_01165 [Methylocystaceae bacterium]|nr:MAG: hypothetical protein C3F11_01165 [Methylocystaceae bacterium]
MTESKFTGKPTKRVRRGKYLVRNLLSAFLCVLAFVVQAAPIAPGLLGEPNAEVCRNAAFRSQQAGAVNDSSDRNHVRHDHALCGLCNVDTKQYGAAPTVPVAINVVLPTAVAVTNASRVDGVPPSRPDPNRPPRAGPLAG